MDNTIQMNLFEYFMDEEQFSIQDATNLVKNVRNINVNNEPEFMKVLIEEYLLKYPEVYIR